MKPSVPHESNKTHPPSLEDNIASALASRIANDPRRPAGPAVTASGSCIEIDFFAGLRKVRVYHAFLAEGLDLAGESPRHQAIIEAICGR